MDNVIVDLSNIKAAIFDMDGTMINNMAFHKKAWKEYFKRKGIDLTDEDFKRKISGANNAKIFENMLGRVLTPEEVKEYGHEKETIYREIYAPEIKEVEGLHNILNQLKAKGLKLGIATTAIEPNRDFALDALGLHGQFDAIVGDEHVTHGKPDPEIYLLAAKRLDVQPKQCIVFEDTPPGIQSAKGAGMKVVALLTSHVEEDLLGADYIVKDFSQVELL